MNEKANYVESKNEEEIILLMAHQEEKGGEECTWYLDTGAINHMTGNKSIFKDLDEIKGGSVAFGDGSKVAVKGKGKILIRLKNGRQ